MFTSLLALYFSAFLSTSQPVNMEGELHPAAQYKEVLQASAMPVKKKEGDPKISASSALVMDMDSGTILWEKEGTARRQIASITKLMTALVILEENSMNDVVKISQTAAGIEGSRIWLAPGDKLSVRDMLSAMLIHSANDAAFALAEFNGNGSIKNFVDKMNKKAEQLDLKNTHYSNPVGFDGPENYSTAEDIAKIATYAYRNNFIRYIAALPKLDIISLTGRKYQAVTTDELLEKDPRFKGLKTGHTSDAGYSFVGIADAKNAHPIMVIIFNSPNRFGEAQDLMDWTEDHYEW